MVARQQRLRPLEQLIRHSVDSTGEAAEQSGDVAIARVHVRRDLLQENDQQRLKTGQVRDVLAQDGQPGLDRVTTRLLTRCVAIEMIDERAVERLLLFEERRDDTADGGSKAAADARFGRRRRELPARVERRELLDVGTRRARWEFLRKGLD